MSDYKKRFLTLKCYPLKTFFELVVVAHALTLAEAGRSVSLRSTWSREFQDSQG